MDGHTFAAARAEIVEMIKDLEPEALTIGQRILAARDEIERLHATGVSYTRIAQRLGVSKAYLSQLLGEKRA